MSITVTGFILVLTLFVLMLLFIAMGHRLGKILKVTTALDITEGAVFTLMALLVAFSFSSANQRYDQRRIMIVNEANAISTAYLRLNFLLPQDQLILRQDFLSYVNNRLAIYNALPDMNKSKLALDQSKVIQAKLWADLTSASLNKAIPLYAPMFLVPAVNTMFDIANSRTSYTYLHLHAIVFTLLFIVVLLSAFLTGYGMVGRGTWHSVHIIAFAFITVFTLYTIIDLEYPRFGFISESHFDMYLSNIADQISNDLQTVH